MDEPPETLETPEPDPEDTFREFLFELYDRDDIKTISPHPTKTGEANG